MSDPTPPPDPQIPGGLQSSVSERLEMLDNLYAEGKITATELGTARRQILSGGGDDIPIAAPADAPPPPSEAPPTVQMPTVPDPQPRTQPLPPVTPAAAGGPPSGGPPPGERKVAGMPIWAAGLIGVVVLGVLIAGAFLLFGGGGGDDDTTADAAASDAAAAAAAYPALVSRPLDQLTKSAVATGKSLARVSEPGDLRQLNRTVERQLDVVEGARASLTRISVVPADQRAHRQLITAAATQRRYLVALGRATSGEPSQAKIQATNRARRAGGETVTAYRTFFRLAPAAPDAITTTDLTDTSGVVQAIKDGIAAQEPDFQAGTAPARNFSGSSFQSPTGNLRCQLSGDSLFCSSSNDGFGVVLPTIGSPTTGSGIAAAGEVVPYGSSWRNGAFTCDSAFDGITCRNGSGNGFFLNRDQYNPF
ncbi:MAG: hypothetical protein AB7I08_08665 [Thermoleophilia bacterium]